MATTVTLKGITSKQYRAADLFLGRHELTEGWTSVPRDDDTHDIEASFVRAEDAQAFEAHVLDPNLRVQGWDYSGPIG